MYIRIKTKEFNTYYRKSDIYNIEIDIEKDQY